MENEVNRFTAARVHAPAAACFLIAAALLAGCAGPSRKRYRELLGECRDHNREHLRMLKEYEAQKGCVTIRRGEPTIEKLQPLWQESEIIACPAGSYPEQSAGAVEMGLGGY